MFVCNACQLLIAYSAFLQTDMLSVMVKHAFTGDNDDEMSVRVGEAVEIVRTAGGGWIVARKANGAEGVQPIRDAEIAHAR